MKAAADLVVHLVCFANALRARGIAVGVGDEVDGARALTLIDLSDHGEVHRAVRMAFKVRRRDWSIFDEVFDALWTGSGAGETVEHPTMTPANDRAPSLTRDQGWTERGASEPTAVAPDGDTPGYSAEVLLRRKPFDACSESDLADMERLLARLTPRLAARRSRRLVPSQRGVADLRRSFRRAIGTGGDLVWLARRGRAIEQPRLVVLCDTSGSMDRHTRFLLAFVVALKRLARSTEIFVFNTSLTRVTQSLATGRTGPVLDELAAQVPDWSGGTKIGESLTEFVARYQDQLVSRKSVVVILSDGLDRGDTTLVADAVRAIRSKARRLIWLNPLAGDPRYEPTARAMQAALPFVDRLVAAHNLESLERLLPELAA